MKMKTNRILAIAALVASLASCEKKMEFKAVPFVAFDAASLTINEKAGTITVDVTAYDFEKSFSQTFKVNDKTAVRGTHYDIVGNDAQVLTFTPQNPTQTITISVVDLTGTFTGTVAFNIELTSATEGVTHAGNSVCSISIIDNDHPLADFIGTWTGSTVGTWDGTPYSLNIVIAADEKDDTFTKLTITGLHAFFEGYGLHATYSGVVNDEKTTITIAQGQPCGYQNYILRGYGSPDDTSGKTGIGDILMVLQDNGTLLIPNAYGDNGIYETFSGNVTLTKK